MATTEKAAYHAQNLRNASSWKGLRENSWPLVDLELRQQSWSGICLTGPDAEASIGNVKDEGGVDFGVEEGLVRVHYVDSARHGIAPLVAFVSRQG